MAKVQFLLPTLIATTVLTVSCRPDSGLVSAMGDLSFAQPRLEAGQTWLGGQLEAEAILRNNGRSKLEVTWETEGAPWEFEQLPEVIEAGETTIRMRLPANELGLHRATLKARSGDSHAATLEILATVLEIPECPQPVSCASIAFDISRGECVETPLADGTSCDSGSACVFDSTCQAGRCVGTPLTCDDGNACTVDTCNPLTGCESHPAPPCPGDGKCQVGTCDPQTGCGLTPASDGTSCGSVTCDAAQVCISGACVVRDPPDGYVCAEPSPCQGAGMCQGSACVRPPPTALQPSWSWDSFGDGTAPRQLHDFIVGPDGSLSLMGFFTPPLVNANRADAIELAGDARRCIGWNGQLACADYRPDFIDGKIALINPVTGAPTWVFDLKAARPDLNAASDALFLARVASLGSDRLAAVYEAYPLGSTSPSGADSGFRNYYLIALDASGGLVSAQQITDPLLDGANHPHPYGLASDTEGNLYVSFSPTANGGAPLQASSPTLFVSYTRDGVLRWKRQLTQTGGELAVARGLVFPENGQFMLDAATGQPRLPPAGQTGFIPTLGRIVATSSNYITHPSPDSFVSDEWKAWKYDGQHDWTFALPEGDHFISEEMRAVSWTPARAGAATETAILGFATHSSVTSFLVAVRASDGQHLWSCPMNTGAVPQLFEVARGSFAMMTSANSCGTCDPPFANSSGLFWTFDVPGLEPASVPWPGTFGGPNHDHLEDQVWSAPAGLAD